MDNQIDTVSNLSEIHVRYVDNELYILASNNNESIELCHIKSGYHDEVNYKLNPPAILSTGEYQLILIGINWGGPSGFRLTLTGDSQINVGPEESQDSKPVGVYWTKVVNFSVTSG